MGGRDPGYLIIRIDSTGKRVLLKGPEEISDFLSDPIPGESTCQSFCASAQRLPLLRLGRQGKHCFPERLRTVRRDEKAIFSVSKLWYRYPRTGCDNRGSMFESRVERAMPETGALPVWKDA